MKRDADPVTASEAETAERQVRSIAYQIKSARFPAYKDLSGYDFASGEVNEALVRQLHRCEFMDGAHNVVLIGGPGTGKTHVATALGVHWCMQYLVRLAVKDLLHMDASKTCLPVSLTVMAGPTSQNVGHSSQSRVRPRPKNDL